MENSTRLVIDDYGGKTQLRLVLKPQPKEGELLVRVDASPISPTDLIFLKGDHLNRHLPAVCGIEGTGKVISANGADVHSWVGKRVTFSSSYGAWCEYSVCQPSDCFEITEDAPQQSFEPFLTVSFPDIEKDLEYVRTKGKELLQIRK